jgi:replicative DNA helicase
MNMTLPSSLDAEKAFISAMLQRPSIINEAADKIGEKLFFHPAHKRIFNSAIELWKEGNGCDLVTITEHMSNAGTLEMSGGASFVTECFMAPCVAGNWEEYVEILKHKHTSRLAIAAADRIIASANDPSTAGELSEIVQKALVAVAADAETSSRIESVKDVAMDRLTEYDEMVKNRGKLIGITSGFSPLDEMTGGFRNGQLIVIGAPTKGGKTAMALNMAMRTADVGNNPVGIISLEMSKGELMDRLIASKSGADLSLLTRAGDTNKQLMDQIRQGVMQIARLPIWIRDESSLNCLQLRAAVRRMVAVHKVKMVVVDYIQLLEPTNTKDSRERQVAEASRTLKTLAKELGIVIIALTQLNADGASRESRAIEHDCDLFLTISQDETQTNHWFLNIKLARACPRASIPLSFRSEFLRFDER